MDRALVLHLTYYVENNGAEQILEERELPEKTMNSNLHTQNRDDEKNHLHKENTPLILLKVPSIVEDFSKKFLQPVIFSSESHVREEDSQMDLGHVETLEEEPTKEDG